MLRGQPCSPLWPSRPRWLWRRSRRRSWAALAATRQRRRHLGRRQNRAARLRPFHGLCSVWHILFRSPRSRTVTQPESRSSSSSTAKSRSADRLPRFESRRRFCPFRRPPPCAGRQRLSERPSRSLRFAYPVAGDDLDVDRLEFFWSCRSTQLNAALSCCSRSANR